MLSIMKPLPAPGGEMGVVVEALNVCNPRCNQIRCLRSAAPMEVFFNKLLTACAVSYAGRSAPVADKILKDPGHQGVDACIVSRGHGPQRRFRLDTGPWQ